MKMNAYNKSTLSRIILGVVIAIIVSIIPLIFVTFIDGDDNNFSYSKMDVVATINDDGSLSMHEEFYLDFKSGLFSDDEYHVYRREIIYSKDSSNNYSSNNHGKLDYDSFEVKVENSNIGVLSASYNNPLNGNLGNPSNNIIAFTGDKNDLNETLVPSERYADVVEIYLKDGLTSDTKFTFDYRIENALNVFTDVSELNWKLVPMLDAYKYNVNLTINLPNNDLVLGENNEDVNKIHYYGHGGVSSTFIKDECNNKQLKATSKKLTENEEMEIRILFPTSILNNIDTSSSNYFNYDNFDNIIKHETDINNQENSYAYLNQVFLYGGIILSLLYVIIMILVIRHVYVKYDKELKPNFDDEYYRELPNEDAPYIVNYLVNEEQLTVDALNATIMDLIRRKYIIIDSMNQSLVEKDVNYKLILNKEMDQSNLSSAERVILDWYFNLMAGGKGEITLNEISHYVENEKGALAYNKYNAQFVNLVKNESKKKEFFDHYAEHGAKKFTFTIVIGLLIAIFNAIGMKEYGHTFLWIFNVLVLSFGIGFYMYASRIKRKTQKGIDDYNKWMAFKHFLEEFSHFDDYPMPGIVVWEHYLVYATTFGIADLVRDQLKSKFSAESQTNSSTNVYYGGDFMYYCLLSSHLRYHTRNVNSIGQNVINQARAKRMASSSHGGGHGGFGGGSSFGGGGGHSSVR